jgi:lactoylglutathione lyase
MSRRYVHTCLRVRDPEASLRFYGALGFEPRGRLQFATAYNLYLGLPGDGDVLELTVNEGQTEPYELGTGYNHMAVSVESLDAALSALEPLGVTPEKPPYHPGDRDELPLIAFVADPDGYRIELIEGDFATPQDPAADAS